MLAFHCGDFGLSCGWLGISGGRSDIPLAEIRTKLWATFCDISDGQSDIPLRIFGRNCGWLYVTFLIDGVTFHCGDSREFVGDFTWHFWLMEWHSTAEIQAKLWVTLRDISGVTFHCGDTGEIVGDFTWHFWWTEWHSTAEIQAKLWVTVRDISGGRSDIPLRRFRLSCGWLYVTFLVDGVTFHCGDSG